MPGILVSSRTPVGLTNEEYEKYCKMYGEILTSLIELNDSCMTNMERFTRWMVEISETNVNLGRRGTDRLLVSAIYKTMVENPTCDQMKEVFVLDWCLEFLQSSNTIAANIMDDRAIVDAFRTPAWHTLKNVGMMGVNDSIVLKGMGFNTLNVYFGGKESLYNVLEDLRRDACDKYVLGRGLMEKLKRIDGNDAHEAFNLQSYQQIVKLYIAYNSFYIPVKFALAMTGKFSSNDVREALQSVLLDIGYYLKIRKDYSDIFDKRGDNSLVESDLKFNWLFVKATDCLGRQGVLFREVQKLVTKTKVDVGGLKTLYTKNNILTHFDKEKKDLSKLIILKIAALKDDYGLPSSFCNLLMTYMKD